MGNLSTEQIVFITIAFIAFVVFVCQWMGSNKWPEDDDTPAGLL